MYEGIVAEFPEEAEAYWGLCLCKFGIEYVDDPATAKKIPTCHRTSFDSIFDDSNFDLACEYADGIARNIYREEAKEIDRLQKEILKIAQNEEPFDVFICYKESDENGGRTVDSELAHDIYDVLTEKGYKVFFSRITLKAKLGQDYEPYIFSALNSAKVMLAVGTKYEYYNAVWVKNEWSRFLALMANDSTKMLIPCYRDIDAYDMPKEFSHLQGQDLSSPRAFQDLVTNIEKIIPKNTAQPAIIAAPASSSSAEPLIRRAYLSLEDGDWDGADKCCEKILDIEPENANVYLIKMCIELNLCKPADIAKLTQPISDNNYFKKALRFADDHMKKELEGYNNSVIDNIEFERRNKIYTEAVKKKEAAVLPEDFSEVIEMLKPIRKFKDADKLIDECDNEETSMNSWLYSDTLKKLETAKTPNDYIEIKNSLKGGTFKGFDEIRNKCDIFCFNYGCDLLRSSGSGANVTEIADIFRALGEYKGSENIAALLDDGSLEYYNKAKIAIRNNDFARAKQMLEFASGFFEADELVQCCKNYLHSGNKDSEDYKRLQSFSEISGGFELPNSES